MHRSTLRFGFISRGFLGGLAIGGLALSYGCTVTSNSGGTSGPTPGTTGPVVDGSELGQPCSGGTSPGDSVAFQDSTCGGGICVVDATGSNLNTYCSADCTNAQCPSGYACKATTLGGTNDCFQTSGGSSTGENDAGSDGSTGTGPTCAPLTGKYQIATTQDPASTGTCADLGTASADFDTTDPSCTNSFASSTCVWTQTCAPEDSEGETSTLSESIDSLKLTGTLDMLTTQDGDGTVLSDCKYDLVLTQQ